MSQDVDFIQKLVRAADEMQAKRMQSQASQEEQEERACQEAREA